jgi:hypothetical protein
MTTLSDPIRIMLFQRMTLLILKSLTVPNILTSSGWLQFILAIPSGCPWYAGHEPPTKMWLVSHSIPSLTKPKYSKPASRRNVMTLDLPASPSHLLRVQCMKQYLRNLDRRNIRHSFLVAKVRNVSQYWRWRELG